MLTRRRRRGEQGQVLITALAMVVFLGLLGVASLRFLDAAFTQHVRTEATAGKNSQAEGAARFAVATVASSAAVECKGPSGATNSFSPASGATVTTSYTVTTCIPDYVNSAPGSHCALCILGADPAALSINNNAKVMITGEVDVNGGVDASNGSICSTSGPNDPVSGCHGTPEFIGIAGILPTDASPFTPAPTQIAPIADPLAGLPYPATLGAPSLPAPSGGVLIPGTYQGLSVSGSQSVTLTPGTYVFTDRVKATGGSSIVATGGVTLFFTCSKVVAGVTVSNLCAAGHSGGALDLSGGGSYQIEAPSAPLPYANIAVFYDRNNTGGITGNTGLKINGNGLSDVLAGGIYAAAANVDIAGNGAGNFTTNGRLVVAGANIHVSSAAGAGLNLVGAALINTCDLYTASVTGTETVGNSTATRTGQVVFVSDPSNPNACGGTRIISFTYTP
jgi:hypothetical protein